MRRRRGNAAAEHAGFFDLSANADKDGAPACAEWLIPS
jgi:hypothetical protein